MIKVLIIDDHVLVRSGMREMLQEVKGISVLADVGTGHEGLDLIRRLKPDIVILDLKLPDQSGLEVTQQILGIDPDIKILIVSSVINDFFLFRLLEAGARGYLTKDSKKEEFIHAVKTVYTGQRIISPQLAKRLALAKTDYKTNNIFSDISEREMEVMLMLIRGTPVKEMAEKLNISHKTVHSYRSRIFEKLNVKTDLAVTLLAIHHGLLIIEDTPPT